MRINDRSLAGSLKKENKKVEISLFNTIEETKKYSEEKNIGNIISVGKTVTEVK